MLSFSCLPSNKTQLENASIQSACIHSSLKHHSSILDTAWSITIVALITKLITISLSSYLDLDLCFIALLFSSHFFDIAFYLLCEQWIYRCSQTYTGGVTFAMDMLSTLESFHGKTDKCGFANHASRFNCFYIACAVLMFFTVESFCFCYFVKDHWRDHCKLEEYYD